MKIGIITIHNSPSYGACLQSYALYQYISMLPDTECEIIDLHRPYQEDYIPSKKYKVYSSRKQSLIGTLINFMKDLLGRKKNQYFSPVSVRKFAKFNATIKMSRPYFGIDDLYANPPLYDIYITGSDQVWNPEQPYCMEPYFLTFAPEGKKRISYAASIGVTSLPDEVKKWYKKWLAHYNAISIREEQGKRLLESFVNNSIVKVADPTFLLDVERWKSLSIVPDAKKHYILLFTLDQKPELLTYAKRLSRESGLLLYNLAQIQPDSDGTYIAVTDAGPREFLGYIAHADLVITDSFHCTAFSIIMGTKNFYTYVAPLNQRRSRIVDLLDLYGLSSHLLNTDFNDSYNKLCSNSINRTEVLEILQSEQKYSRDFLLKQIMNRHE